MMGAILWESVAQNYPPAVAQFSTPAANIVAHNRLLFTGRLPACQKSARVSSPSSLRSYGLDTLYTPITNPSPISADVEQS